MNETKHTDKTEATTREVVPQNEDKTTPCGDTSSKKPSLLSALKNTHHKSGIALGAALGIVVVAACIVGIILAISPFEKEKEQQVSVNEQVIEVAPDQKINLAVNVKAQGWSEKATKATIRIEAAAPNGEAEPLEREMVCNEPVVMMAADEFVRDATYKVTVVKAPVLEDGSTFSEYAPFAISAPSDTDNTKDVLDYDESREDTKVTTQEINQEEKTVIVEVSLSAKAASEMSEAELEQAADDLAAAGNTDAAQSIKQNNSDQNAGGATSNTNTNSNNSGNSGSGGSGGGNNNTPTPTPDPEPAPTPEPVCQHNWMPEQTTVGHMVCSICGDIVDGDIAGPHMKAHALNGEGLGSTYSKNFTIYTGRYYCPLCGAWK